VYLIYMDESGNTGNNLEDPQQPVFLLGALLVHEDQWRQLEARLLETLEACFPSPHPSGFEVHGVDLRNGSHSLRGVPLAQRLRLRDEWMGLAAGLKLKFFYRHIIKVRFADWQRREFGTGDDVARINPHVAAFAFLVQALNRHLAAIGPDALGILIADENKETSSDLGLAQKQLRMDRGDLRLSQVIERGFFIDSTTSLPLQLCDLCALYARKKEEAKAGLRVTGPDQQGIALVEPLIHRAGEAQNDVLQWLVRRHRNKGAARETNSGVGEDRPAPGR
jgi:hypothetical protein